MSFLINLVNENLQFTCEVGETVLDAALKQGVALSHGCRNGYCSSCKGQIISGEITYPDGQPDGISNEEVRDGDYVRPKHSLEAGAVTIGRDQHANLRWSETSDVV